MTTWSCTLAGEPGISTIEAPTRASAARALLARGQTPVLIEPFDRPTTDRDTRASDEPISPGTAGRSVRVGSGAAMSRSETAMFIRELATALIAGLPLTQAMRTLGMQGRSAAQRQMIDWLVAQVEQGRNLSDAVSSWGRPFNELIINLIRAGEVSGKLGEVLLQASDLLDRDLKLRRAITGATLYPLILLVLIVGAVVAVVTIVIPRLLEPLKGQISVSDLPWPTRVLSGSAEIFSGFWWIILPGIALAVASLARIYRSPVGRFWIDSRLLRVPALGRLLRDVAVARFTRTLATLTAAGIPILASLKVTKRTLGNAAMERVIDHVCEQVTAGRTLAEPMEKSGLFPPMLIQIINLGERSGRLDEMMHQAARAFEDRTEVSLKLFTTAFPPILIVFMAGIVGFIVAAVILALLQFQESVSTM